MSLLVAQASHWVRSYTEVQIKIITAARQLVPMLARANTSWLGSIGSCISPRVLKALRSIIRARISSSLTTERDMEEPITKIRLIISTTSNK